MSQVEKRQGGLLIVEGQRHSVGLPAPICRGQGEAAERLGMGWK